MSQENGRTESSFTALDYESDAVNSDSSKNGSDNEEYRDKPDIKRAAGLTLTTDCSNNEEISTTTNIAPLAPRNMRKKSIFFEELNQTF